MSETMIAGVDRFLLRELEASIDWRAAFWNRDFRSSDAYEKSVESNRQRLARMIGLRDARVHFDDLELVATFTQPARVGQSPAFNVYAVRWPVLDGVHGEGLLLEPKGRRPCANVVVMGDCEQLPESLAGIAPGVAVESQVARRLAESGCRVVIPMLVNRKNNLSVIAGGKRRSSANHREILYRAAYQMGRHLIGYEVQKVQSIVDWFSRASHDSTVPVGVVGYGEGGQIALYAGAIDPRIKVTGVSGFFNSRQGIWREPIDRNVFGLLREFGDAELATLVVPRTLIVEASSAPMVTLPAGGDSAPAEITTPEIESVRNEVRRAKQLISAAQFETKIELVESNRGDGPFGSSAFLQRLLEYLAGGTLAQIGEEPVDARKHFEPEERLARQFRELAEFSQRLVVDGPRIRAEFMSKIDRTSGLAKFSESSAPYREYFRNEIIGVFDHPLLDANPRTRLRYDEPQYLGYDVVLDIFPDVMLYGILLLPKDIQPGERRPVVVCQHGLEGRAEFTVEADHTSYRAFAARLAKRGFITFSPQHLYRGGDRFRTLQRKANPLKKSLFSVMVAQHQQLLNWLSDLEYVDRERIAFYGISYGGKSAMRIPAVLPGYCLSICSSDYSDWIWRTVSNRFENGYLGHSEYEIFEFDLGTTFNYGDLAALICPRPFMVEDFHRVNPVAESNRAEYSRVSLHYEILGIGDRTRIGYFTAFQPPATYVERETFEFLHEHLKWPPR